MSIAKGTGGFTGAIAKVGRDVARAAKLPAGHPARTAVINRNISHVASSSPTRQQAGTQALHHLGLSPAEKRYVQIKLPKAFNLQGQLRAAGSSPTGLVQNVAGHGPKVGRSFKQFTSMWDAEQAAKEGPHPSEHAATPQQMGYAESHSTIPTFGQKGFTGLSPQNLRWARREAAINKRNAAELAAIVNPFSGENVHAAANVAWQMTGIPTLEHPVRSGPMSDVLAAAGLFPFGKVAKLGDLAKTVDEAANVGEGAAAAKDVAATGRIGKALEARRAAKALVRGPARTEDQAVQHVLAAAKKAKQQGFGRILPEIPKMKPGEISAETGGQAGQIVREGLKPGLGPLRTEQEAARAVERSKRAGAIERAAEGKTGLARHVAAKAALEGKLPAGEFKGFAGLTPELRDQAINHIYEHPHLQPFEKVRTADALDEAIAGKVPTKGDQKLLEHAFGKEQADGILASVKQGGLRQSLVNILGVPRSLMASGDVSAPFRQGLVVLASHPKLFFSEFGPMLKSVKSEADFQGFMRGIHEMPTFPMMEKAKLALTDIGTTAHGVESLSQREEQFVSNLAEQIPGVGHIIRASDRAYVGFLNKTRADLFNVLVHQAASEGYHLTDKAVEDIAKFVNSATGRGDIGKLANHTATMNVLFFSPRLLMSRLNFLNPAYYARLSPFARMQAIKAAGRLAGTLSLILYAAKLGGAQVNLDPRNADFGKIRIGNTRIDIAGGFQQPLRLAGQLATGEIVSSTSGRLEHLTGGFAGSSRLDVLTQFLEGKLAPVPGAITDVLKGQQFSGQPLDFSLNPLDSNSEIMGHLTPLALQDALATGQQTHSVAAGIGGGLLSGVGVGVQSYSPQAANSPQKTLAAETKALTALQKQEAILHVPAQWRPVYAKGVKVEVQRDLAKRQARKVSQTGKITDAQSYKITMQTLLKNGMMTRAQYKAATGSIGRMSDRELRHWEYEAWNHLGPGLLLERLHHYYNVKTGK